MPPGGVSASDGAYTNRVKVSWEAVSGAQYYRVYRSESKSGAKTLVGQTKYLYRNDYTAVAGQTYWYWVTACTDAGCSKYSAVDIGWLRP
ncbi:hypothetical protein D6779_05860 [Candidatus Parcubacteria bacterium]|nr:MAG: hypothetical protein D6779_05860 [Candidatus Parcubacteria bacterium]